jgi:hypothetical protein
MGEDTCPHLHAAQERKRPMENLINVDERSAWNNLVEAREARRKAKDAENSACDEYMRAMDLSLEYFKNEQAAFDVWLRARQRLPLSEAIRNQT